MIAAHGGNVLTIHQTIPLQGMANVMISIEASQLWAMLDGYAAVD